MLIAPCPLLSNTTCVAARFTPKGLLMQCSSLPLRMRCASDSVAIYFFLFLSLSFCSLFLCLLVLCSLSIAPVSLLFLKAFFARYNPTFKSPLPTTPCFASMNSFSQARCAFYLAHPLFYIPSMCIHTPPSPPPYKTEPKCLFNMVDVLKAGAMN